jgi:hypothetical protein
VTYQQILNSESPDTFDAGFQVGNNPEKKSSKDVHKGAGAKSRKAQRDWEKGLVKRGINDAIRTTLP